MCVCVCVCVCVCACMCDALIDVSASKALDRNPGPGYNTILLRLIPGDL